MESIKVVRRTTKRREKKVAKIEPKTTRTKRDFPWYKERETGMVDGAIVVSECGFTIKIIAKKHSYANSATLGIELNYEINRKGRSKYGLIKFPFLKNSIRAYIPKTENNLCAHRCYARQRVREALENRIKTLKGSDTYKVYCLEEFLEDSSSLYPLIKAYAFYEAIAALRLEEEEAEKE